MRRLLAPLLGGLLACGAAQVPDRPVERDLAQVADAGGPPPAKSEDGFRCTTWHWSDSAWGATKVWCARTLDECETLKYFERTNIGGDGYFGPCVIRPEAYCARMRAGEVEREVCRGTGLECLGSQGIHEDRGFKKVTDCRKLSFASMQRSTSSSSATSTPSP